MPPSQCNVNTQRELHCYRRLVRAIKQIIKRVQIALLEQFLLFHRVITGSVALRETKWERSPSDQFAVVVR